MGAVEQVRGYYVNWRMLRDVKRRQMAFDYADERLRINALRKNTVLPKELQVQCNISTKILYYIIHYIIIFFVIVMGDDSRKPTFNVIPNYLKIQINTE